MCTAASQSATTWEVRSNEAARRATVLKRAAARERTEASFRAYGLAREAREKALARAGKGKVLHALLVCGGKNVHKYISEAHGERRLPATRPYMRTKAGESTMQPAVMAEWALDAFMPGPAVQVQPRDPARFNRAVRALKECDWMYHQQCDCPLNTKWEDSLMCVSNVRAVLSSLKKNRCADFHGHKHEHLCVPRLTDTAGHLGPEGRHRNM